MAYWDGQYAIIAGPYDGKRQSHLYEWLAHVSAAPGETYAPERLNPEPSSFIPTKVGSSFQLLSDDGKKLVNGKPCKELPIRVSSIFGAFGFPSGKKKAGID